MRSVTSVGSPAAVAPSPSRPPTIDAVNVVIMWFSNTAAKTSGYSCRYVSSVSLDAESAGRRAVHSSARRLESATFAGRSLIDSAPSTVRSILAEHHRFLSPLRARYGGGLPSPNKLMSIAVGLEPGARTPTMRRYDKLRYP